MGEGEAAVALAPILDAAQWQALQVAVVNAEARRYVVGVERCAAGRGAVAGALRRAAHVVMVCVGLGRGRGRGSAGGGGGGGVSWSPPPPVIEYVHVVAITATLLPLASVRPWGASRGEGRGGAGYVEKRDGRDRRGWGTRKSRDIW